MCLLPNWGQQGIFDIWQFLIWLDVGKLRRTAWHTTCIFGHIGIFVFRYDFLKDYLKLENTPAMLSEDIEWLKLMEQGNRIISSCVEDYEIGVNLPEDYQYLLDKYNLPKN